MVQCCAVGVHCIVSDTACPVDLLRLIFNKRPKENKKKAKQNQRKTGEWADLNLFDFDRVVWTHTSWSYTFFIFVLLEKLRDVAVLSKGFWDKD